MSIQLSTIEYTRGEMLYNGDPYYKWTAKADRDNPYYWRGADHTELNRTEGYEVLYFINHIAQKHWTDPVNLATYQKIERMMRYSVPAEVKTHYRVAQWIMHHWDEG